MKIRRIARIHRWFMHTSRQYVGVPRETIFGYTIYEIRGREKSHLPLAYCRFMWLSRKDILMIMFCDSAYDRYTY